MEYFRVLEHFVSLVVGKEFDTSEDL
eukprot:COSAG03_NODE_23954_length_276_cov_0.468927_1_plen_25_part_10